MSRVTVSDLQKRKADNAPAPLVVVTAYDATMARLVDLAGVDVVLVGDSLGMVVQGAPDTLGVSLDHMVYHTLCVSRGLVRAHLCADLPFMSYQVSPEQALVSAGRLVQEGRAQSVKLEGGQRSAPAIRRIVEAGIPVMGHIGLTPQSVNAFGGFKVQGRGQAAAEQLLTDARAVQEAGAWSVVLEMVPLDLAARVTAELDIPTIGIGAGPSCDGQVLVCNDLLGMDLRFTPRFVRRFATLEATITDAVRAYAAAVRDGSFPTESEAFHDRRPGQPARAT